MVEGGGAAVADIKAEIYHTDDSKVIAEDELLNFIVIKMQTLSDDDIVLIVTNSFSSKRIKSSKCVCKCLMSAVKRFQDLYCTSWMNYPSLHLSTLICLRKSMLTLTT